MLLSDQRHLHEAIACLTRYVDLIPDSSSGWTALGVAQARPGDIDRATATLQRALELDPDNSHALRNLGAILIQRSPEKALPVLESAAQRLPDDQPAQYGYAACLLELGRTSEAHQAFMKAAELNPLSDVGEAARKARSRRGSHGTPRNPGPTAEGSRHLH